MLEWEPLPKAKRGHEREFADLFRKLQVAKESRRDQLLQWFADVTEPAYALIGAPCVGTDEVADAWLRAKVEKSNRLEELDAIAADMAGTYVLDLLPPCEGFPVYRSSLEVERYTFHAELLRATSDELGVELCELAYTMMLPEALSDYATRLFVTADRFAADHKLPEHVATIREPVFPEGTDGRRGHVLYAAAKWCEYWSVRGHGLAVTF
jgi:hypothetical protein